MYAVNAFAWRAWLSACCFQEKVAPGRSALGRRAACGSLAEEPQLSILQRACGWHTTAVTGEMARVS